MGKTLGVTPDANGAEKLIRVNGDSVVDVAVLVAGNAATPTSN